MIGRTCNEAFIKAIGMGLSFPLKSFSVEMDPLKPATLCSIEHDDYNADEWYLTMLEMPENYSAALAVKKYGLKIETFSI